MGIEIRPVAECDTESIVRLLNPIIEAGIYTIMEGPVSMDDQRAFIRQLLERATYHAAVSSETEDVVGIQDVQPLSDGNGAFHHVGEISTFVALDARRNGVGQALTEVTVQAARERDFTKLCANVRADNPDAVAFYERQGFRVIGTAYRHAQVGDRYVDEILMEKLLA